MLKRKSLKSFIISLCIASLPMNAYSQRSKGSESWIQAQQAFARLEYPAAFRYANDALRRDPGNIEARRVAAKSAKELEKYSDCLRIMGAMPVAKVTPDDVSLVGECSAASNYSPWTLNFLKQNAAIVANRDMANYWLGRYYYKKGDYAKANSFLANIVVLPARLEKDRTFMLSRIKDVLKSQSTTNVQPATPSMGSQAVPQPAPPQPPPVVLPLPQPPPYPSNVPEVFATPRPSHAEKEREPRERSREKKDVATNGRSGYYNEASFLGRVTVTASQGSDVLDTENQRKYDELSASGGEVKDEDFVNKLNKNSQLGEARLGGALGYRFGSSDSRYFDLGVSGGLGMTASYYRGAGFYDIPFEMPQPNTSLLQQNRGFGAYVEPILTWFPIKYTGVSGSIRFNRSWPSFSTEKGALTEQRYSVGLMGRIDPVAVDSGFTYLRLADRSGNLGLAGTDLWANVETKKIWYFSLRSFRGYPLVRYSVRQPLSTDVPAMAYYMQLQGSYLELNIVPRIHIQDNISIPIWYHSRSSNRRSYVRPGLFEHVNAVGHSAPFAPSAEFRDSLTEWVSGVDFAFQDVFSVFGGVSLRKHTSQYLPSAEVEPNSARFSRLLTGSLEDRTIFFVDVVFDL